MANRKSYFVPVTNPSYSGIENGATRKKEVTGEREMLLLLKKQIQRGSGSFLEKQIRRKFS